MTTEVVIDRGAYQYLFDRKSDLARITPTYKLYVCRRSDEAERDFLLQVSRDAPADGLLDRSRVIFELLLREASELELAHAPTVATDKRARKLNYQLQFPDLVDTFTLPENANRRVNILAFRGVLFVAQMMPLIFYTHPGINERRGTIPRRIDLRTSVWVTGKLLKLLAFSHSVGVANHCVDGSNILLEEKLHYVAMIDWTKARLFDDGVPEEIRRGEISTAIKAVIILLGGDENGGGIPNDGDAGYGVYTDFLKRLAHGREKDAKRAHDDFYRLADSLWERKYWSFRTIPL